METNKINELVEALEINANVDWSDKDPAEEFTALAEMAKAFIPTVREIMVERLGNYISEDADRYESTDEALTLLEAQSEKDGFVSADDVVMMWEPLEGRYTVYELLDEL